MKSRERKVKQDGIRCYSAALRGRYTANGKITQRLEIGNSDTSNAITTVVKDSMIIEISDGKEQCDVCNNKTIACVPKI